MKTSRCAPPACPGWERSASPLAKSLPWTALRTQTRRLQLGLDALARDEPRLHSHGYQSSRAALVYRGAGCARRRQRSAEWRNRVTPDVLIAIRDKKLLPVDKLDRGFVFPDYPARSIVSYFQAGTICDFIGEKWGEDKLLDMVHSYAKLQTTPQAIQQNLGLVAGRIRQAIPRLDRPQSMAPRLRISTSGAKNSKLSSPPQSKDNTTRCCSKGQRCSRFIPSMSMMPTSTSCWLPPIHAAATAQAEVADSHNRMSTQAASRLTLLKRLAQA